MSLYALFNQYYQVAGREFGRASLWDGERLRVIGVGDLHLTSGYLAAHEGHLYCGRSSGAGSANVHHGPALYDALSGEKIFADEREDWNNADDYTALAFVPGYVCWLVRKAVGVVWYGTSIGPNGEKDRWNTAKGQHTDRREVWLLLYSWPAFEPQQPIVLEGFHEASNCGGMCYDPATGRLYVSEVWPPEKTGNIYTGEAPRIQVYQVATDSPGPEPEPVPDEEANEHQVRIEVEGVGTFTGSGVWRKT